ncbi:FHA domain-containing protein FHA2 [Linum perenne]
MQQKALPISFSLQTAMGTTGGSDVEAGFAKLQGEDFEYYMQTYSIVLGRNSKKSTVDVDLTSLGGGMNISRHHARIFYDFTRRRFALEVLGKNGCLVEGVLHLPGNPPVKLDSQDLLQIGDKEFYFLLPLRSILGAGLGTRHQVGVAPQYGYHSGKKGRGRDFYEEEQYDDDDDAGIGGSSGKKIRREGYDGYGYNGKVGMPGALEKKGDGRCKGNGDSDDDQQLLQLEEKDVVSSVATVLSDLCGPGEWMAMEKLHAELLEQYSSVWHHRRVRKYLTAEDWRSSPEAKKDKPWYGLLMLLRKYPEHFVINTRSKGRVTLEFVSLVSLLS